MYGCISAPGAPGFGAALKLARALQIQRAQQTEVTGGKGVGLPESSHRDVLCGPFADAGNFTEAGEEVSRICDCLKAELTITNCPGKSADGLGPRAGEADAGKVGIGENLRRGK